MSAIPRPAAGEHAPFYQRYVDQVPGDDVLRCLAEREVATQRLLAGLDEARAAFRYAEGKWSVKQVVGHMIDAERTFAYRALAFARGERAALPSMDQDEWIAAADFDARPFAGLVAELRAVRAASLPLFASFTPQVLARTGIASGNSFTVRSLAWIVAGHEMHHLHVLAERYGIGRRETVG